VKVNRRWRGANGVQIRVLCAGVALATAAIAVLGGSSHSRQAGQSSAIASSSPRFAPASASSAAAPNATPLNLVADSKGRALAAFMQLPLMFEPNVGQSDSSVKFLAHGTGYGLFLGPDGAVLSLRAASKSTSRKSATKSGRRQEFVGMRLAGANRNAAITGTSLLPGKSNYFLGNNPAKWHRNVPHFAGVKYENIYPGINLVFYGNQGRLEYDFQVAPGADPARAELEFSGLKQLELSQGAVILKAANGSLRLEAPQVYQQIEGRRQAVAGRFVLRAANRVGFEVGPYDHTRELVIDPTLSYSTYFGGSGDDTSPSIAVDGSGNIYLAGTTDSLPSSFPPATTVTLFPPGLTIAPPNTHVFVAKIDTTNAAAAVYETFLGGTGSDSSVGIAVDGGGNAYVAGTTSSADFPTTPTNAYQAFPEQGSIGTSHVFVVVLDATGSNRKYSSYLSGNNTDIASGMTIDARGNLYVTGTTFSTDQPGFTNGVTDAFPAAAPPTAQQPAFQSTPFESPQFFVTKVNTATLGAASIAYSTYFGGAAPSSPIAVGGGIAVDSTGNIYFTGTTNFVFSGSGRPPDFPILNAYQPCLDQPPPTTIVNPPTCANTGSTTNTDGFVAKLNPNASSSSAQLIWSTYFGGAETDSGTGIALDSGAANIYITGTTLSPNITTLTTFASFQECFDTPVNPATLPCPAPADATKTDAYVARFNNPASGNMALTYFSYLGGTGNDTGAAIAVDTANGALLTGATQSTDFPVTAGAIQSHLNPGGSPPQDAFLARINTAAVTGQNTVGSFAGYFGGSGTDRGTGIALDTSLNTYFAGDTTSPDLQTQSPLETHLNGGIDTFAVKLGTAAAVSITGKLSLGSGQQFVAAGNQATFVYTITNTGPDLAHDLTFTDNFATTTTGVAVAFNSASISSGSCSQTVTNQIAVCAISTLQPGSTSTVTIVLTPATGGNFNGGAVQLFGPNNILLDQTSVSAQASDFTLAVSPANQTLAQAGAPAAYTATLKGQPVYGVSITVNCSTGLPPASTCQPTTSSVTLTGSSPVSDILNIATTPRPVTTALKGSGGMYYGIWLAFPGMAVLGLCVRTDRRRRRLVGILLGSLLFGLLALQPACSGSSSPAVVGGTPAGTYTITVTATSGTLSHNQTFTLTVP
jgi:hypothetical protein